MAGEKILSVDDSPTVQRLIDMILSSQGYQVVLASDGEEGIAKAKQEKPAVVLVDFVMPKMNGFQVCKTLKEDPEFKNTPIILVTSKGDKVGSKFVDVLGITEYFTKPFQPEELLAKIREAIDRKNSAAPVIDLNGESKPSVAPPGPAHPPASSVGIEVMIKDIVEKTLEEFIKTSLPDIIRRELGKSQPAQNAGIKGNLATFRIIEVMQMLGLQRQTGKLSLARENEHAAVYFRDGAVVFAACNGTGESSPLDGMLRKYCKLPEETIKKVLSISEINNETVDTVLAREKILDPKAFCDLLKRYTESEVYKIMAWREGEFFFEKVAPPFFANQVRLKVDDLLLEGARRADEWMLIQQRIPSFSLIFEPLIGNADELTRRGMSDADVKIFSLIDGKRTVQEIIDATALGEFDVAKSMFILLSVNLIRRKK